jgi:hypothetical protein
MGRCDFPTNLDPTSSLAFVIQPPNNNNIAPSKTHVPARKRVPAVKAPDVMGSTRNENARAAIECIMTPDKEPRLFLDLATYSAVVRRVLYVWGCEQYGFA